MSMSSISMPESVRTPAVTSGMRLLRPLPRACRFMTIDHLACQAHVCLGALRFDVVKEDRATEARRLPQPDVAWDDAGEHPILEEFANVVDDLAGEIGSVIEHRQKDPVENQLGVDRGL